MPATSPVGYNLGRLPKSFQVPLFCAAGRYLAIILRIPVGIAVTNEVIYGMVNIEGYFA